MDRTISNLNHLSYLPARLGIEERQKQDYLYRYALFPEAVRASFVAGALENLFEHYPRDQVLILQYETCKTSPASELARTFEFLGLDPAVGGLDLSERVNEHPYQIERPDTAERQALSELLQPELRRLAALDLGLDLDVWR